MQDNTKKMNCSVKIHPGSLPVGPNSYEEARELKYYHVTQKNLSFNVIDPSVFNSRFAIEGSLVFDILTKYFGDLSDPRKYTLNQNSDYLELMLLNLKNSPSIYIDGVKSNNKKVFSKCLVSARYNYNTNSNVPVPVSLNFIPGYDSKASAKCYITE